MSCSGMTESLSHNSAKECTEIVSIPVGLNACHTHLLEEGSTKMMRCSGRTESLSHNSVNKSTRNMVSNSKGRTLYDIRPVGESEGLIPGR